MKAVLGRFVVVAVLVVGGSAWGQRDLSRQTVPAKWLDKILPEQLPALEMPKYYSDLEKARAQVFHGRYRLGLLTLRKVKDADAGQVAVVKAMALAAIGSTNEAMAALTAKEVADQPAVQVLRARLLADMGQVDDAIALLGEHLKQKPQSIPGRYYLGVFNELKGDLAAAVAAYGWFDADQQKLLDRWRGVGAEAFGNRPEDIVLMGRAYDRLGLLQGRYRGPDGQPNKRLHDEILNVFVSVYDTVDQEYWPAHLAAAEYYLTHDMTKQAGEELAAAANPAQGNPSDRDVLSLAGQMALAQYNFDRADAVIAAMRKMSRGSATADILEGRNYIAQRRPKDAEGLVNKVLARQPRNLEALGLLAAVQMLQLQDEQADATLRRIEQIDPDNATAYLEVAEALGAMRQYPRAIEKYEVAIKRAGWWPQARTGLGLLYTQSGDEEAALRTLSEATLLDPFNERALNYLKLLDGMQKLSRVKTEHFEVVFDAKLDPMAGEYFGEYMESVYAEVCKAFDFEPKETTLIEIFPTHDAFSVRVTGNPLIGTVGASTGRVIALVVPRKAPGTMGNYNWAQVLRHEFTHTVTLGATDNRIAHWMTEGLAVQEERSPLRWEWVPMLYQAVTRKQLFDMEKITWAFWRPKRPIDRQLAYAQSFWICQYIEQTAGREALLKMMAEFRNGTRQEEAFVKVLGKSTTQFSQDFTRWAEAEVAKWGYDAETTKKYNELRAKGDELVAARKFAEAIPVWEEVARLRPVDELPRQQLAGLYLRLYLNKDASRRDKAIEYLTALHKVSLKNNSYAKMVAGLHRDAGKLDEAAKLALEAIYINPYDLRAHEVYADICRARNDEAHLAREERVIPILRKMEEEAAKAVSAPPAGQPEP